MEFKDDMSAGAELLPILLEACPSFRQRREAPGPKEISDVRDYTRLVWDFAAHSAEMLAAQRAAELVPAFVALDEYHKAQTEAWLKNGPGCFFERFLKEADEHKTYPRLLGAFLPPRLKAKLEWFIDRPDDGDPYPIDGFY